MWSKRNTTLVFAKPADYSAQIANALECIKTLGSHITEADVDMLLEPFKADYGQMKIFQRIIDQREQTFCEVEHRQPKDFSKTFETVEACTLALQESEELKEIADKAFTWPKLEGEGRGFAGIWFVFEKHDTYNELAGQSTLLDFAKNN